MDYLFVIGIFAWGICSVIYGTWNYIFPDRFSYKDYAPVSGILAKGPEEVSHHDNSKDVIVRLTKYSKTKFVLECHSALYLISKLRQADTVELMIDKQDATDLLAGNNIDEGHVYAINQNNKPLFTINDYRETLKNSRRSGWIVALFGLATLGVAYWMYKDTVQQAS